ncbi:helix-turn-helix domain-containing protein [Sphaerochaeta globosa]|jgi:transcriptional regulator with XRE-family HTH domain|uniref:Helix-turn-helix domain protein n=1 Tax=Sphaerochaeta globosa (strain ATCC BAA-1886 / DSM 22777 / Buddy) TaxID=158189 RepID=F0RTJ4_SPHGB|nr:XRE family transcriptional regulator [Sphaerochaeta globosa]ADY13901.1 helix-turn-helix domain protein [Sphaerochaeta globosa str. Buddy]
MENPPMIGKNIQRIRNSRKLTLNVLSERSGVSKAMLSQIESDKVNPTVATVWKIARGLNVELNDLLDTDDQPKRVFSLNPAGDDAPKMETHDNGVSIRILSPLNMVEELEMYLLTFEGHSKLASEPHYPGTQEFLTVVKGAVKVQVGENTAEIKKGDFLVYHCDIDHSITNESSQPATVHMVVRFTPDKR